MPLCRGVLVSLLLVMASSNAYAHTSSVGFAVSPGTVPGAYNLEVFYGGWHGGALAPLGNLELFALKPGGNASLYTDYTVSAYGSATSTISTTVYPFTRATATPGIIFPHENGTTLYTPAEITAAGFVLGSTYFFDGGTKLVASPASRIYNHQSAIITNLVPGSYRFDYASPKPTSVTWTPVASISKMIPTITSTGAVQVAGTAKPAAFKPIIHNLTVNNGELVSTVFTTGIAVEAVDNADGVWQYSMDGGATWLNFTIVTGGPDSFPTTALLLPTTAKIHFVPNHNYVGTTATLTFRTWDGTVGVPGATTDVALPNASLGTVSAAGTIAVTNASPIAVNDTAQTAVNQVKTINNVLANDTDPDLVADVLSVASADVASLHGGTVTNNNNGTFNYIPRSGFSGVDSFTYTVSDGLGGTSVGTVSITMVDATPPVIRLNGASPTTAEAGSVYADLKATATDDVDPTLLGLVGVSTVSTAALGAYTVTYNHSDAAGNAALSVVRNVTVVDTTPPALTAPNAITKEATAPLTPVSLGVPIANDIIDGTNLTITSNPINGFAFSVDAHNITWMARDQSFNTAIAIQTVTVVDTTSPVLTTPAAKTIAALNSLGTPLVNTTLAAYLDTYTATDLVGVVSVTSNALTWFPLDQYTTVTWTVLDAVGNQTTGSTVIHVVDLTPPVIQVPANITITASEATGSPITTFEIGQFINRAIATDNVDVGPKVVSNDAPQFFLIGTTTVSFSATDIAGNSSTTTATVTVTVIAKPLISTPVGTDVIPPAIRLIGQSPYTFVVSRNYVDQGVTVIGNQDGDISSTVVTTSTVNSALIGTYVVKYTVTDQAGNTSVATRVVNVVSAVGDNIPPVITMPAIDVLAPSVDYRGTLATDPYIIAPFLTGVTASDNVDPAVTVTNDAPTRFLVGKTKVTFTATDVAGNSAMASAWVTVNGTSLDITPSIRAVDSDGDNIPDAWEMNVFGNLTTATATSDADGDGLLDGLERILGTNAKLSTTNLNGISDPYAVGFSSNPSDYDGDGILDVLEDTNSVKNQGLASGIPTPDRGNRYSIEATGNLLKHVAMDPVDSTKAPSDVDPSYGVLAYDIYTGVAGSTVQVTISSLKPYPSGLKLYKVDALGVYVEIPKGVWTQTSSTTIVLSLTDGGAYDLDNDATNGQITDPIAIGAAPIAKISHGGFGGGGCSLQSTSSTGFDPMLPILMLLAAVWLGRRKITSLARGGMIALAMMVMVAGSVDNAMATDLNDAGPWRAGVAAGAFQMSAEYPGDTSTYKKVLPGYVVNLGYMVQPWLETGVLINGGGQGTDTQAGISVELSMPILPQVYARARNKLGANWGIYGLMSVGSMLQEARNAADVVIYSDRVVTLGLGAGISYDIKRNLSLDLAFVPAIALGGRTSGFKTIAPGGVLALNYAFGAKPKPAPVVVKPKPKPKPVVKPKPKPKPVVKPKPKPKPVVVKPEVIKLDGVFFGSGSSKLGKASSVTLDQAVRTLKRRADIKVEVAAHTDSKGRELSNLKLSNDRAQSVKAYLVKQGIHADRLEAKGYGEAVPVADNETDKGRAINRRVELRVK